MKILFITRKFPPSVGGMELLAFELYQALDKKTDVKLIKWGGPRILTGAILPYLFIRAFYELLKGDIDVIHVNDGMLSPIGLVLSKLFRKPFSVIIHGLDLTWPNELYQLVIPRCVQRADAVMCISREVKSKVDALNIDKSRVYYIPLAIEDNLYNKISEKDSLKLLDLSPDSVILLSVGRLVKRKGVEWFINNVLGDLVRQNPKLVFLVIGDGQERQMIDQTIKDKGLEDNVRMLGRVSSEVRLAAYNSADIFVMPNISVPGDIEGFGLVLLEASTCCLPIVASGIEGIKDAIADGKNGVLVPASNPRAFINQIEKFLSDKKYAKDFGLKARDYTLENYRWDNLILKYIAIYESLK
jgi:glycosyltransferase involved in cell wall biosynthesis